MVSQVDSIPVNKPDVSSSWLGRFFAAILARIACCFSCCWKGNKSTNQPIQTRTIQVQPQLDSAVQAVAAQQQLIQPPVSAPQALQQPPPPSPPQVPQKIAPVAAIPDEAMTHELSKAIDDYLSKVRNITKLRPLTDTERTIWYQELNGNITHILFKYKKTNALFGLKHPIVVKIRLEMFYKDLNAVRYEKGLMCEYVRDKCNSVQMAVYSQNSSATEIEIQDLRTDAFNEIKKRYPAVSEILSAYGYNPEEFEDKLYGYYRDR